MQTPEADLPNITTGAFPIAWLSNALVGQCATVTDLTPSDGDVHDLELSPSQTAAVVDANLIVTASGFQSAFDDAVSASSAKVLDLISVVNPIAGHEHGHSEESEHVDEKEMLDPHFWLDPNRMILAAAAIRDQVAQLSDECNEVAQTNYTQIESDLIELDLEFKNELAQCESRTLVVSHEAFGYLGHVYDLEQIAVTGIDPESEPSAARITEIINLAREQKVSAVFTESSANPAVAEILASELSLGVLKLDPIELKPDSLDYLQVMRENLVNLTKGLNC